MFGRKPLEISFARIQLLPQLVLPLDVSRGSGEQLLLRLPQTLTLLRRGFLEQSSD